MINHRDQIFGPAVYKIAADTAVPAEQRARDLLESLGVKDAQTYTTGDLVKIAQVIAERDLFARMITAVAFGDPGSQELWPVGPETLQYDAAGNHSGASGPWFFLKGRGATFIEAIQDHLKKES